MIAEEIPAFAEERGFGAAMLADPFSLSGAYEFQKTAVEKGVHPLIGATFEMAEGGQLVLAAKNKIGYRSLSRLVTECHMGEPRQHPLCNWERLERHSEGLLCLTGGSFGIIDRHLIRRDYPRALEVLHKLIGLYGQASTFIQIERANLPWSLCVEPRLLELAEHTGVLAVAGGPIHFERKSHFPAHDVLVCIENLCLVEEIEGRKPRRDPTQPQVKLPPRRALNAERYFRSAKAMEKLFADRPDLLVNAWRVAEQCEPNVLPKMTQLPRYCQNEDQMLDDVVLLGAQERYGRPTREVKKRIQDELERIHKLGFARHFLIAWDMCNWAREQDILLSGRGSVVDSVVAYCLGISRIDAHEFNLHFNRFLPPDGSKRPDIDIDFEAHRREDVRQYLVKKYGDAHVATVAAIGTYGSRGVVREVGKVMGIPLETVNYLTKRLHGSVTPERLESALDNRPELRDSGIPRERFKWVFKLAERLADLPRNIRAHSCGVIISETPIADTVPVMHSAVDGVKIIQWDKRSAKKCFDKFDVLCLRGNDVLGGTERKVGGELDVTNIPLDDPEVFRTMRAGQLIGIPQSASPAMRQAHIRIQTQDLKDAGIVQAGIRPGVGGAVKLNEYIARRKGKQYNPIHVDMDRILGPTLGIVVFQEQIDLLMETFCKYSSDQAEEIREDIHKNRKNYSTHVQERLIADCMAANYTREVAEEVCTLISGFKGYGFAEGHALSFAEVSIRSIHCQQNYPAPYFAALLDAQPAGYYGPRTIANEARTRGVKILPPCVNTSSDTFQVEGFRSLEDPQITLPNAAIRVSLPQISGVSKDILAKTAQCQPYATFFDFVARIQPNRDELEQFILCGALDGLHPNRRALMWAIPSALGHAHAMQDSSGNLRLFNTEPALPTGVEDYSERDKAIAELRILGLNVEKHLMAFERERVRAKGGITSHEASNLAAGKTAFVVGHPIRLRFPPTESGKRVLFFDLEDETGLLNVTCFDDVYQRDGHKVVCNQYITLWGESQDRDGHIAFLAHRILAYQPSIQKGRTDPLPLPLATSDFLMT